MAITGAVSTALRQDAPYQAEIAMGAQLIMDFQGARSGRRPYYWYRGTRYTSPEKIPGWSFSRNSEAYAEDSAGNLIKFPANVPRITNKGFLVEEARTETCGNSGFDGVALGALTDGGVIGTGGFITPSFAPGLTVSVVEIGSANGAPYADIRVQGTPASSPHFTLFYQANSNAPAAITGEQWVNSAYIRLVGGSLSNVALVSLRVLELTAANAVVATQFAGITVDSNFSRKDAVLTLSGGASTAKVRGAVAFSGSGAPVDYTVRIQLPNFQKGDRALSPVLTTGSAATRPADSPIVQGQSLVLGQFRTNLLTYSQAFDNPAWAKIGAGTGLTPVLTPGFGDPLGGAAATRIVFDRGAGTSSADRSFVEQPFGGPFQITSSIWLRADAPVSLSFRNPANNGGYTTLAVTTSWQRFEVSGAPSVSSIFQFGLRGDQSANQVATVYAYGSQAESGPTATAYIVTTNAAASVGNPIALVASADLTAGDGVNRNIVALSDGSFGSRADIRRTADNKLGSLVVTNGVSQVSPYTVSNYTGSFAVSAATRLRASSSRLAVNGSLIPEATVIAPSGLTRVDLGCILSNNYLNGYLRRVMILGDVDDAQLQRLAA